MVGVGELGDPLLLQKVDQPLAVLEHRDKFELHQFDFCQMVTPPLSTHMVDQSVRWSITSAIASS